MIWGDQQAMDRSNLNTLLQWRAEQDATKIAYRFINDTTDTIEEKSYQDIYQQARLLSQQLLQQIAPGERVLLLFPSGLEFVIAFFACLLAQVIAVPAYPPRKNQKNQRLLNIIADCQPVCILTTAKMYQLTKPFFNVPALQDLIVLCTDQYDLASISHTTLKKVELEQCAFLQYTSGSTGTPKGVMVTHANIMQNLALIHTAFGHNEESKGLIWLPLFHDMGLIGGVLAPLYGNFPVTLMPPTLFLQKPLRWLQLISELQITTSGGPNFAYAHCLRHIKAEQILDLDLRSWRVAFTGAEPVRAETLQDFSHTFALCGFSPEAFYPCYGMAEATLFVSGIDRTKSPRIVHLDSQALQQHQIIPARYQQHSKKGITQVVSCGKPGKGYTLEIVDPKQHIPCQGIGEIWLQGKSISAGYWHQAETNQQVFAAYLANDKQATSWYRTGDLGFILHEELYITGRLKDVIIIRGRNYYPQDIEHAVEKVHPALQHNAGVAFAVEQNQEEQLIIIQELQRHFLRDPVIHTLPHTIREAISKQFELQVKAIILLKPGRLPKTSSGKVQRHASKQAFLDKTLAGEIVLTSPVDSEAGNDQVQDKIQSSAEIKTQQDKLSIDWKMILGADTASQKNLLWQAIVQILAQLSSIPVTDIQPTHRLLELGIDSVSITRFSVLLEEGLGIHIALSALFDMDTLNDLQQYILQQLGNKDHQPLSTSSETGIPVLPRDTPLPLSSAQQRFWFMDQMQVGNEKGQHNIFIALRLQGHLQLTALEAAFETVIARHEALRTTFFVEQGVVRQEIRKPYPFKLEIHYDLSRLNGTLQRQQLQDIMQEELSRSFDLTRGASLRYRRINLIRARMVQLGGQSYALLLNIHHIIADGWSMAILMQEIVTLYNANIQQQSLSLPALAIQYPDYAAWQQQLLHSEYAKKLAKYWQQQLHNAPVLELPSDYPRSAKKTIAGDNYYFHVPHDIAEKIPQFAVKQNVTVYVIFLSAFYTLLYHYTQQEDLSIGTVVANRRKKCLESIVGCFVNTLVLRQQLSANMSFTELLKAVKHTTNTAWEHQDYPFDKVVESLANKRDVSINPLFQVMFAMQNDPLAEINMEQVTVEKIQLDPKIAQFDLNLEIIRHKNAFSARLEYSRELFSLESIHHFSTYYLYLLQQVLAYPERALLQYQLMNSKQIQTIYQYAQGNKVALPESATLDQLLAEKIQQHPYHIAVIAQEQYITYQQLGQQATQWAHYIQSHSKDHPVIAVCMHRSVAMVVAFYACLQAGKAYLPLDPDYPKARLQYMLKDSQADMLLIHTPTQTVVDELGIDIVTVNIETQEDLPRLDQALHYSDPEKIAYMIYTSGSSGQPKGVMISHKAAVNHMLWMIKTFHLHNEVVLQKTPCSFDASVWEFWASLLSLSTIVMAKPEGHREPEYLIDIIQKENITLLQTVPSLLKALLATKRLHECQSLRLFFCGGEVLNAALAKQYYQVMDNAPLINLYGPTEACIDSSFYRVPDTVKEGETVAIGSAIDNVSIYIVNPHYTLMPVGIPGEIVIAGAALAKGYWNNPLLTKEKFVITELPEKVIYKTGDKGRYRQDGSIEYLGRIDEQVKLRGFRIELDEISYTLNRHQHIENSTVILKGEDENAALIAFICVQDILPPQRALRQFLLQYLPEYMVPYQFITLDTLPLTANGKVDKNALYAMHIALPTKTYIAPHTPLERELVALWKTLLDDTGEIGREDNFFELGGHSLLATQLLGNIQQKYQKKIALKDFFSEPTIAATAQAIEKNNTIDAKISPAPAQDHYPLSFAQQRIWLTEKLGNMGSAYNMPASFHLKGKVDIARLEMAWQKILQRHHILHARFFEYQGQLLQRIEIEEKWQCIITDLTHLDYALAMEEAEKKAEQESAYHFNLDGDQLLRVHIIFITQLETLLLVNIHHIISDGWSVAILLQELQHYYNHAEKILPPLPIQYIDYVLWQRQTITQVTQTSLSYWQQHLINVPEVSTLPSNKQRPLIQSVNGRNETFTVSEKLTLQLKYFTEQHNCTLFMVLVAAYHILLRHYLKKDDICIGIPSAGRILETEGLIGCFIQALAIRVCIPGKPNIKTFMQQIKTIMLDAYTHQDVPFEVILDSLHIERNPAYPPLVQLGFAFNQARLGDFSLQDIDISQWNIPTYTAKYDVTFFLEEQGDILSGTVEYNTDLYLASTIRDLIQHYLTLLEHLVNATDSYLVDNLALIDTDNLIALLGLHTQQIAGIFPLSPIQQDMYWEAMRNPETLRHSFGMQYQLPYEIDINCWKQAIQSCTQRYAVLRCCFKKTDKPYLAPAYQYIDNSVQASIQSVAWEHPQNIQDIQQYCHDFIYRQFDLDTDPLLEHLLIRDTDQVTGVIRVHHLIMDGIGITTLFKHILASYQAIIEKRPLTEEENVDDYAAVLNTLNYFDSSENIAYLKNLGNKVSALDYFSPTKTNQNISDGAFKAEQYLLDNAMQKRVKQFCKTYRITPAIYFRTLYALLLANYTAISDDFIIYEVASGRNKENSQHLGCFFQQLAFIIPVELFLTNHTLKYLFGVMKQQQKQTYQHTGLSITAQQQYLPQGKCQFSFNYYNFSTDYTLGQQSVTVELKPPQTSPSEVQLIVQVVDQCFQLQLYYAPENFDGEGFLTRLKIVNNNLLKHYQQNTLNECYLTDIDLISAEEKQQLINLSNNQYDLPAVQSVAELMTQQAEKTPTDIALISAKVSMEYATLHQAANRLAHYLQPFAKKETAVVLLFDRGVEMMVALLASIKAGLTYLPIDAGYPKQRLLYLLEDSDTSLIITQPHLDVYLPDKALIVITLDEQGNIVPEPELTLPDQNIAVSTTLDSILYMIYTSGSTGKPKGTLVTQQGEINLLQWYMREFSMQASDKLLLMSAFGFDLTQKNLLAPLCCGAKLVIPPATPYDPEVLSHYIATYRITWINCAPSAFYPLLLLDKSDSRLQSLRYVILGGEPINFNQLKSWLKNSCCTLVNSYGPTECTDIAAFYSVDVERDNNPIPIGKANDNVHLYILNSLQQLLPKGIPGQLSITGKGVGAGYWNAAEKTADVFIDNPYYDEGKKDITDASAYQRLYLTGDIVYYDVWDNIVYLGRKDHQIKLRGLRIETGEIENCLKTFEGIEDALVLVDKDQLVAYLVASASFVSNDAQIRQYLADYLPSYMIPVQYSILTAWPLTANGKIDRNALPAIEENIPLALPDTVTEITLAGIWSSILGIAQIGLQHHFFELGGHSLLVTQLAARIRQTFKIDIALRDLFERPVFINQAAYIDTLLQQNTLLDLPELVKIARDKNIPLSFPQQRLWFLDQYATKTPWYNLSSALVLKGQLDIEILRQAFEKLIHRHEILRTTFFLKDAKACQEIRAVSSWKLMVDYDLSALPGALQEQEVQIIAQEEASRSFDLTRGTLLRYRRVNLFRTRLIRLNSEQHILLLVMHHIITDAWSMGVLVKEIAHYYKALCNNTAIALPELSIQYADYAHWQQQCWEGGFWEQEYHYWQQQLKDVAILELPTDYPRTKNKGHTGKQFTLSFPEQLSHDIKQCSQQQDVTLFMTLLSAFKLLLAYYSSQKDICVGTPIAGRTHVELEALIGFFVNTLALRSQIDLDKPFSKIIQQVKETTLAAYAHQHTPFEKLVEVLHCEREGDTTPLFQVMFILQNVPFEVISLPDLEMHRYPIANHTAKFELSLALWEENNTLQANMEYHTALFSADTIARMMQHYQNILYAIVENWEQPIANMDLLSLQEKQELFSWNETQIIHPALCVHGLFIQQAEATPDTIALIFEDQVLTYQELHIQSNQLAHYLLQHVSAEQAVIGLCVNRSIAMIVAMLGILKAGKGYVPLDPNYPAERLAYMLKDSDIHLVLTQQSVQAVLPFTVKKVLLDTKDTHFSNFSGQDILLPVAPQQIAYIIYTSGSTGKPKGVAMPHQVLNNLLHWQKQQSYTLSGTYAPRTLQFASYSFDVSFQEIFATLCWGGSLVCIDEKTRQDFPALISILQQYHIQRLFLPYIALQHLSMVVKDQVGQLSYNATITWMQNTLGSLEQVITAGEQLNITASIASLFHHLPDCQLINQYGPSETHVVTAYVLPKDRSLWDTLPPIGKPIDNAKMYVLNAQLQRLPKGIAGELYIAGDCLALGYWQNDSMTAERFIPDPFAQKEGTRMYRTGDIVRYNAEGEIEYLDRIDQQVKIRGYRIELGEIEIALMQHEAVRNAVVQIQKDQAKGNYLVAYVELNNTQHIEERTLRQFIQKTLPDYMLPSAFVLLDKLPLTPSGKIDRKSLPQVESAWSVTAQGYVTASYELEQQLVDIMQHVLQREKIGIEDNFFEIGGHSLLATQFISHVQDTLQIPLPLKVLFNAPTIKEMAAYLNTVQWLASLPEDIEEDEYMDFPG